MKRLLGFLFLVCSLSLAQTAVISPVNPPVYQGQTQTFACASGCGSGGVWSVSGAGSINSSTGVYTAPASVTAQQTLGGYQLFPNNHIFNTRIDSLPQHLLSTVMIQSVMAVQPNAKLYYGPAFTINWTDNSTPRQAETFQYSGGNNGNYQHAAPPGERWELGYYGALAYRSGDHHVTNFNTQSGQIEDKYVAGNPTPYTLVGGIKYTQADYNLPTPPGLGTNAPGTVLAPLLMRASETNNACASGGSINHAFLMTLHSYTYGKTQVWPASTGGYQCTTWSGPITSVSVTGGTATVVANNSFSVGSAIVIAGLSTTVLNGPWILTAATSTQIQFTVTSSDIASTPDSGTLYNSCQNQYSVRYRLKQSFDQSGYSACQQVLINQLKQYGLFFTDGSGGSEAFAAEGESGNYSPAASVALKGLTGTIPVSAFEVVDESGLEISSTSGETNLNQETVCYTPTGGTAGCTDVVLQGVAVNLPQEVLYVMAGTPTQQLTAFVHDGASNTVTWSMSPTVGTLTSGGSYTAPSSVSTPTSTTITATSTVNPAVSVVMTLWTFPASGFFGIPTPIETNSTITGYSYTDPHGNVWPATYGYGLTNSDVIIPHIQCWTAYCSLPGLVTPGQPFWQVTSTSADINTNFLLPAGKYAVTYNLGTFNWYSVGSMILNFIGQGNLLNSSPIDVVASVGVGYPYSYTTTLVVGSDNKLSFAIWGSGTGVQQTADISSMSIIPLYSGPLMQGSFTGVVQ
jgi:hypothetical protein